MLKSLLWKNTQKKLVIDKKKFSEIAADFNLDKLYAVMSKEPKIKMSSDIFLKSLTSDSENIKYRQCILADFLKRDDIEDRLEKLILLLDDMAALHKILKPELLVPKLVLRIKKLELYNSIMEALEEIFAGKDRKDFSEEFQKISEEISKLNESNRMPRLLNDIIKAKEILSKTKSLDIGINLDHQYAAREAIVLSLNDFTYKKSNIIEKLVCKNDMEKKRLSVATEIDVRNAGSLLSFKNDLDIEFATLLKREFSEIDSILADHQDIITSKVLDYRNEICLYYGAVRLRDFLSQSSCDICFPSESSAMSVTGMYSFIMAYEKNISNDKDKFKVVTNDIFVGENESPLIITGANEGGKTVLLSALAINHLLFQNGLMIPATEAKMPVYDKIYSHFPKDEDLSLGTGRLGEEAVRVSEIINKADNKTLVLMNEPFITTSPTEGLDILVLSIKRFHSKGVKLYFVTHYLSIITEISSDIDLASYVMEYTEGRRTYKAIKRMPMEQSHALDIAKAHGIDAEGIIKLIKERLADDAEKVKS